MMERENNWMNEWDRETDGQIFKLYMHDMCFFPKIQRLNQLLQQAIKSTNIMITTCMMRSITWEACLDFHRKRPWTWSALPLCPLPTRWWYSSSMAFSCRAMGAVAASTPRNLQMAAHSSSLELSFASKLKEGKDSPPSCVTKKHLDNVIFFILYS